MRQEASLTEVPDNIHTESEVSSVLAAYKSEGDPLTYETAYLELRRFVDESLDIYKVGCMVHTVWTLDKSTLSLIVICYSMNWP